MTNKIYVGWQKFHLDTQTLVQNIKNSAPNYNHIVAVSRGGLIPAGLLAYELNIRNCDVVNMSSYDGDTKRDDANIELSNILQNVGPQTLIIDDLSDSGRTFRILRKLYPQATFVCVYAKEKGKDMCDIYARTMPDEWIVFPWD